MQLLPRLIPCGGIAYAMIGETSETRLLHKAVRRPRCWCPIRASLMTMHELPDVMNADMVAEKISTSRLKSTETKGPVRVRLPVYRVMGYLHQSRPRKDDYETDAPDCNPGYASVTSSPCPKLPVVTEPRPLGGEPRLLQQGWSKTG